MTQDEENNNNKKAEDEQRETSTNEREEIVVRQHKDKAEKLSKKLGKIIATFIQKFNNTCAWDCFAGNAVEKMDKDKKKVDDYLNGDAKDSVPEVELPELPEACSKSPKNEEGSEKNNSPQPEHKKKSDQPNEKNRKTNTRSPVNKPSEHNKENFMAGKIRRFEAYKRLMRIRAMQKRREADQKRKTKIRPVQIDDARGQALRQINPADPKTLAAIKSQVAVAKPAEKNIAYVNPSQSTNQTTATAKNPAASSGHTGTKTEKGRNQNSQREIMRNASLNSRVDRSDR